MPTTAAVRSIVLWFPDWQVSALLRDAASPGIETEQSAIAVVEKNVVVACSVAARSEGVRRGQRRRDAQTRCPGLAVVTADPVRDQRLFAPVVSRIEQLAPGVQIIRPGLCALRARGPARYYGGEAAAARALLDGVREMGLADARAGIADGLFTAELAARIDSSVRDPVRVVRAGESAAFLSSFPIAVIDDASPGLGVGAARSELAGLLARLGVQTLGEFAALEADRVRERWGERGVRLHALASGHDPRAVEPRVPPAELYREAAFDPPLELADQVGFAMRTTADVFLAGLGAAGLVCTELRVELEGEHGERSERVWLHPESFDAADVVDRVRWQLGEEAEGLRSGVVRVRIAPEAVDAASHHAPAIFGAGSDERAHHALSRVQAMLGHRGVLTAAIGGGRWLDEREVLVPWGDRAVLAKDRSRPWPGSLADPLPATVHRPPIPVEVASADGSPVVVGERDALSAPPAQLTVHGRRRAVDAWAGPWPVVEREWDAAHRRRAHRFQVVDAEGVAWLLVCESGVWTAEGSYD